jgi:DNA-binding transcriptional regulator YbjK
MTTSRRLGAEDSATRTALLDAAQHPLLEEGYAAVTSRRVAARAGLKPQLGMTTGHAEVRALVDRCLARAEGDELR